MSGYTHGKTIADVEIDLLTRLQEGLRHASFGADTSVPEAIEFLIRTYEGMKTIARLSDAEAERAGPSPRLVH